MDTREEIRQFLTTRRAKITPQQAGLTAFGGNRRVTGLRRHEVAMLAGVSVEYYTKLERGNLAGASEQVLEAVARALQLDEAERAHLLDLAKTANAGGKPPRRRRAQHVRPGVLRLLETMTDAPAFVRNGRLDLLAVNPLARALYSPALENPANRDNLARFCFLDPAATTFYPQWEDSASTTVNLLRTEAGRDPYNPDLTELVGELSTRSQEFRARWAKHDVRLHHTGTKRFHHPAIGELDLAFEAMPLPADPGLTLTAYHAEPGSPADDALHVLASWSAPARQVPDTTR
ncbi:helix-turn-helix transcriptional regulator [Actinocrinis sp.]|uniref:helix-turn-helix transcriptional regulator n=1 Tax=Actinocrinis sp. TaxID=1920516 RepID=UPI002D2C1C83|nr:helix-turn-helix transcriptional regulator [Actinocrinis sp.]HZP53475.1 helix-turn-helix transcriptional regulator [Actinocrinis sp.]